MKKQQLIIIDGPDGCGKTNIAEALSKRIGVPVFKNSGEWDHFGQCSGNEYFDLAASYLHPYVLSFIEQTGTSVILDRSHPSEWAYSRVFDRPRLDGQTEWSDCRSAKLGAKVIIAVRSNYSDVVDEHGVQPEHLAQLDRLYREYANITECDCLLLNVDDENLERELAEIIEFLSGDK